MKFQVINEEDPVLVNELVDGVRVHVHEQLGDELTLPLSVISRDDNGELIGGVSGRTIYRNFLIGVVWVDKKYRGTGLGRQLMELAEDEAIGRGCLVSQVDTLSIQAPVFYQKLGFEIIGSVPEFPGSPARYFLMKTYGET
ncbi:GCN5-related N-acetyltransferase [Shewanella sediminis HAW-EB3]|uniref:GCN5-related N-acetyltransferase n=1 Tax=Shewanella sediminis (strain HAW-EB3) TaxID=425104 RepID=A8FWT6_SHESH|nr:GNAT family N-acetyltransferase [Shewanella sediminis]ABV37309.1 GCN5-related N-acetyltransferase [Shewanella sediminis HAW-EB3]